MEPKPTLEGLLQNDGRLAEQAKQLSGELSSINQKLSGINRVDKQAEINRTLAGDVDTDADLQSQLAATRTKRRRVEEAREFLAPQIATAKYAALTELCKSKKPLEKALMTRLLAGLTETHAALLELTSLKEQLIHAGGVVGICLTTPDFLGSPTDPTGDMSWFFHAAKKAGFTSSVPAAFR
jgi:chromosome segregation ATPase